jgi:long-subunit fatty acid transport protein
MAKSWKFQLLVLANVLIVVPAVSQNIDWNITGAGARAEGFGGAFIGVADDATSIVWNPAGLATLERPEASLVTRYISETTNNNVNLDPSLNTSDSQSHFAFNFGSVAYPLKSGGNNIVLAIAYQRQLDFYAKVQDRFNNYDQSGGANTITPGVGIRVSPLISLGVAANFWGGKYDISSYDVTTSQKDFSESGTFSGTNFTLGALFDFSSLASKLPLKLGVSLKTAFNLKADLSDNDISTGNMSSGTTTAEMPSMIGLGAAYQLTENLTVAADYETRGYGSKSYSSVSSDGTNLGTGPMSASKEDLNQLRLGAEYLIVSQVGVFPIRVGYRTVPTVMANYDVAQNPSSQVHGTGFSIGSGYIADRFAIDVTYNHVGYTQSLWTYGNTDYSIGTFSTSLIVYF